MTLIWTTFFAGMACGIVVAYFAFSHELARHHRRLSELDEHYRRSIK
jgi:hypothetical protein